MFVASGIALLLVLTVYGTRAKILLRVSETWPPNVRDVARAVFLPYATWLYLAAGCGIVVGEILRDRAGMLVAADPLPERVGTTV